MATVSDKIKDKIKTELTQLRKFSLAHFVTWRPMCKIDQSVGKCLYFNALTESERLNDSKNRSETCSEAELIVVRPERNELLRGPVLGRTHYVFLSFQSVKHKIFIISSTAQFLSQRTHFTRLNAT